MRYLNGHVSLPVADLRRAVDFYTGTLALELKVYLPGQWAEVAAPGVTVGLRVDAGGTPVSPPGGPAVGLLVADLDAACDMLRARGVAVAPPVRQAPFRRAGFCDPDGHPLYLVQYLPD